MILRAKTKTKKETKRNSWIPAGIWSGWAKKMG